MDDLWPVAVMAVVVAGMQVVVPFAGIGGSDSTGRKDSEGNLVGKAGVVVLEPELAVFPEEGGSDSVQIGRAKRSW